MYQIDSLGCGPRATHCCAQVPTAFWCCNRSIRAAASAGMISRQTPAQLLTCLRALAFAPARSYSVVQPSRTADGSLSFPVRQPPSRLTLLFPFSQTHITVITGGYETVHIKVSHKLCLCSLVNMPDLLITFRLKELPSLLEALILNTMAHM